ADTDTSASILYWLSSFSTANFRFSFSGCGPTIIRLIGRRLPEEPVIPSKRLRYGTIVPLRKKKLTGLGKIVFPCFLATSTISDEVGGRTILNSFSSANPQCLYRQAHAISRLNVFSKSLGFLVRNACSQLFWRSSMCSPNSSCISSSVA